MQKGICVQCGKKTYGLMCDECLKTFEWSKYVEEVDYATYGIQEDKIRIYSGKVSEPLYAALGAIGFLRAPAQGCFYNAWSPNREDVALWLCDEILDDESSLEERAEDRALRFATYSGNAGKRASQASAAADEIAKRFEFGQPILLNHHSAKRALRDKERINQNMRRACEEFDRRDYWKDRATSAEHHAAHMTAKGTVINRIKKLEGYIRKERKEQTASSNELVQWLVDDLTYEQTHNICNYNNLSGEFSLVDYPRPEGASPYEGRMSYWSALTGKIATVEQLQTRAVPILQRSIQRHERMIEHYEGQLEYWKSFLVEEHGNSIDEQVPYEKGHWIQVIAWGKPHWGQVTRINRRRETKRITTYSVDRNTWLGSHYTNKWAHEDITNSLDHKPEGVEIFLGMEGYAQPVYTPPAPDPEKEAAKTRAAEIIATEIVVNHDPDFFPTPTELVERMVDLANLKQSTQILLEPSAGDGRIAEEMQGRGKWHLVHCCETNFNARKILEEKDLKLVGIDFLDYEIDRYQDGERMFEYDCIVMNPPFSKEQDIQHILHAWDLLAPGGRIVAIMSEHAFFASNNRCTQFREWLSSVGWDEKLPADTFKESGTSVNTRLVVIDKPEKLAIVEKPEQNSVGKATQQGLWAAFE